MKRLVDFQIVHMFPVSFSGVFFRYSPRPPDVALRLRLGGRLAGIFPSRRGGGRSGGRGLGGVVPRRHGKPRTFICRGDKNPYL